MEFRFQNQSLTLTLLGFITFILFILIRSTFSQDEEFPPSVVIEAGDLGRIKGFRFYTNRITKPYYNFGGIPYGTSVSGRNRFKPSSVRNGSLTGDDSEYIANKWGSICPQNSLFSTTPKNSVASGDISQLKALLDHPNSLINRSMFGIPEMDSSNNAAKSMGNEECLHLHINSPRIPTTNPPNPDELLPVIVYLHGGSFMSFWSSLFNGGRLLNKDVVFVPINYRLGVLGFFNLGIDDAPGNAGLYDALTALRWIQRYIAYFGGDPNRVTITGQSAGAAAVVHLMASPLAKGLFQNVIACSGTAFLDWAVTSNENSIKHALIIAQRVNCYTPGPNPPTLAEKQVIYECMATVDDSDLVANLTDFRYEDRKNAGLGFHAGCPSIQDNPDLTLDRIIPENPFNVFEEGRQNPGINLMLGTTRHDGSFVLQEAYDDFLVPNNNQNNSTYIRSQLLADILKILGMEDKSYGVIQSLADTFMGDNKYSDELEPLYPGLMDMFNVFFYKAFGYRTTELNSKLTPKPKNYLFSFDHKGIWSLHALVNIGGPIKGGVSHTDDQIYLYQWFPFFNARDQAVATRWVNMWVNFAYYGNPNGPDDGNLEDDNWPPFPRYLKIGQYHNTLEGDIVGELYREDWKGIAYDLYPPVVEEPNSTTTEAGDPTTEENPVACTTRNPGGTGSGSKFQVNNLGLLALILCLLTTF